MTDRFPHRLHIAPSNTLFSSLLPRILLMSLMLVMFGCESFDSPPEEADDIGLQTTSGTKKPHKSARPGLFKNFRDFMADGTECHASWWTAPDVQPDVWDQLKKRYQLKTVKNERVAVERNWYVSHQAYLNRVSSRANRYLYHVKTELEKRQLPGELALLPIVESAYNPYAYSTSQASGLWQFIPGTAKHLGMNMNWWYDDRRDIVTGTDNALNYLTFLRDHYNGDWLKALAAYNAGWGTIDRAVAKNKAKGLPTDYWNLDVPDETKAYVPKMLALAQISQNPDAYGIHWAYIPDLPYFGAISSDKQIDIPLAADTIGINTDVLYLLNPGLSRWATPPGKPRILLVPIDQANDMQEFIANTSRSDLKGSHFGRDHANPLFKEMESNIVIRPKATSSSRTYQVKKGDTWWSVANAVGISSGELQKLNKVKKYEALKIGQTLAVPGKEIKNTPTKKTSSTVQGKSNSSKHITETIEPKKSKNKNNQSAEPAPNGNRKVGVYTVKKGDTLMNIARLHNVSVDDLAKWNGMNKKSAHLSLGQKIKLQP